MKHKQVTINARKFDGALHRSWNADLISEVDDQLLFRGVFEREVIHEDLGTIRVGTVSYEYYWLGKWFNIFRFYEPDGEFRNFYCNISMPPTFSNDVLEFIDLDIDILVQNDWSVRVLDENEFADNAANFDYGADLIGSVDSSIKRVRSMIESRDFPFNLR